MGGRAAASPGGGPLGPLGTPLGVDTPPMVVVVGVLRAPLGPGPPRGGRPIMGGRAAASPGGRPAGCGGGCFEAAPWRVGGGPLGTALGIGGPLGPGARGGAPSGGPAAPRGGSPRGPPVGGSGDRLSPPGICSAGGLPGGGGAAVWVGPSSRRQRLSACSTPMPSSEQVSTASSRRLTSEEAKQVRRLNP